MANEKSPAEDFKRRVRNNGVKIKNVPNVNVDGDIFAFSDYVSRNPGEWGMVPAELENMSDEEIEEYVSDTAENMYDCYEWLDDEFSDVTVDREVDDMYWVNVIVSVPEDSSKRERIAEQVAEAINQRMAQ